VMVVKTGQPGRVLLGRPKNGWKDIKLLIYKELDLDYTLQKFHLT